jgi:hypothetical protein
MCKNNNRNSLGKGEVVSSILTGSTRKARQIGAFCILSRRLMSSRCRTVHERRVSKRAPLVHGDRRSFTEKTAMTVITEFAEMYQHMTAYCQRREREGWRSDQEREAALRVKFGLWGMANNKEHPTSATRMLAEDIEKLKRAQDE